MVRLKLEPANIADAAALAVLHTAVADHLTSVHGQGPWSWETSEKGVLFAMRNSRVYVARRRSEIIATLRLATKKPWAIDKSYFTPCEKPLYLLAMAVAAPVNRVWASFVLKRREGSRNRGRRMRSAWTPITPPPARALFMGAAATVKWGGSPIETHP